LPNDVHRRFQTSGPLIDQILPQRSQGRGGNFSVNITGDRRLHTPTGPTRFTHPGPETLLEEIPQTLATAGIFIGGGGLYQQQVANMGIGQQVAHQRT